MVELFLLALNFMTFSPAFAAPHEQEGLPRLEAILNLLSDVPSGRSLMDAAKKTWKCDSPKKLATHFQWSDVSRTDTVLTRHYNPQTGAEERARQIQIFLREDQPVVEVALDMVHELVHATARPSFDPY